MKRQILRFPVGPQFRKILEDDHEWKVITDMHLRPLVMRRGDKHGISHKLITRAYEDLISMIPEGNSVRIYDLHSHIGGYEFFPSGQDLRSFIENMRYQNWKHNNIQILGQGVISKSGILIVKMPESEEQLQELTAKNIKTKYDKHAINFVKNKFDAKSLKQVNERANQLLLTPEDKERINNRAFQHAYTKLKEEEPNIRTQPVRKTHRGTMRRWRR